MTWEDPDKLLKFKFGREEYCQRMLTSLILASPYPKWNSHLAPSEKGEAFLKQLYELIHAEVLVGPFEFIDEFDLPAIDKDGKNGAPDYAVLTPNGLWIIELKTKAGSHCKEQMPYYERLALSHYPDKQLDLLCLTSDMQRQDVSNYTESRYSHLFWSEILDLISGTWLSSEHAEEQILSIALVRELSSLDRPTKTFSSEAAVIREAIILTADVQHDGKQRAVEVSVSGLEELIDLRVRIADAITRDPETPNVRPWIWYKNTSGGKPLTEVGRSVGCELRLSKYK